MKVHTNAFKEEINKMGRQIDGKIYYSVNYNLTSETNDLLITENNLQFFSEQINENESFKIQNENIYSMSFINNGDILCSLMKEFDFESNIELQVGIQINPYFGVLVNGEYEYLDYGKYIIKSREYNLNTETWNYVCYDKMMFFMVNYEPLNITYPISVKKFLLKICEKIGVDFEYQVIDGAIWYPNSESVIIYEELFKDKGYTYRDVLDKISEIYAGNLLINKNNNLSVHRLAPLPSPLEERYADIFDETFLKDLKTSFNKKIGPINRVVVVDSENNIEYPSTINVSSEETNDVNELRITDNEFVFNGDTYGIVNTILVEISDLEYYYCDFTTTGICYLDYLDKFLITRKGVQYPCLLLNNEITITTGIEETIFADEPSQIKSEGANYNTSIINSKETSFIVNKQKNEINSKVSKDGVISAINQSAEGIQIQASKISLEGKEINLTSENINIASDHFNVDDNGNITIISTTSLYTGAELQLIGQFLTNYLYSSAMIIKENNYSLSMAGIELIDGKGTLNLIDNNGNFISAIAGQGINVVGGNISATGTVTGSNIQSDEKLKKNIKNSLINATQIIKKINHREFDWKENNKHVKIGYIAQELEKIDENFVIKKNDTYYVNLLPILATATKAIQEQQDEINELKEMIKNGKY